MKEQKPLKNAKSSTFLFSDFRFKHCRSLMVVLLIAVYGFYCPVVVFAGYKATFTPKISIREEYTGNVFFTSEDTEDDFVTVVSPGFDVEISGKRKGITISYTPEASFYSNNSENDTLRHNASINGWVDISRNTRLEIYNTFRRTEEPFTRPEEALTVEQPPAEVDTTRRRRLEPYYTNTTGFNLAQQIGKTDSVTIGYAYSILENEDSDVQDNARHNPSIAFSHQFSPYMDIGLSADYMRGEFSGESDDFDSFRGGFTLNRNFTKHFSGNVRYTHTIMDFKGETEDYQIYDPSIGFGYVFGENASVSLNIGYFIQDRRNSEDETGLSVNGNVGKTWQFKRGAINISGSSGYGESYFGAENLGFNTYYQVAGVGNYMFTKSLNGRLFGSYRENKYVNLVDDRTDKVSIAGVEVTYSPLTVKWLNFSLTYTYRQMDSTEDENDFEEDRVQLNISMTPSRVIQLN